MTKRKEITHYIIHGLGFGDESKGSMVDYYVWATGARLVVRFNGGPQAAHNVEGAINEKHCFSQFGSGTLIPGTRTYLSRFMLVDPLGIKLEETALREKGISDAFSRLTVDRQCVVVTPFHKYLNRMREESRGEGRHGSCGKGVGNAAEDAEKLGNIVLRAGDLLDQEKMYVKLNFLWHMKIDQAEQIVDQSPENAALALLLKKLKRRHYVEDLAEEYYRFVNHSGVVFADEDVLLDRLNNESAVFEGAQGALLDQEFGFYPYVTRSRATSFNARELLNAAKFAGKAHFVGVIRVYATRHGPGPFVTEDESLHGRIPPCDNKTNAWQGRFRLGYFDLVATRYAIAATNGINYVAITNFDRLYHHEVRKVCTAYEFSGQPDDILDKFFTWSKVGDKIIISDIKLVLGASLEERAGLTLALNRCRPIYQEFGDGEGRLCNSVNRIYGFIQDNLKFPIGLGSIGPTRWNKFPWTFQPDWD